MNFEFTSEQIVVLGFVASLLVFILRFVIELLSKKKIVLPEWAMNTVVFVVGIVFAVLWLPAQTNLPSLPVFDGSYDIFIPLFTSFVSAWLTVFILVLSFAVFIYKYLIVLVKDKLNQKFLPRLYK